MKTAVTTHFAVYVRPADREVIEEAIALGKRRGLGQSALVVALLKEWAAREKSEERLSEVSCPPPGLMSDLRSEKNRGGA